MTEGRAVHFCTQCGKAEPWGPTWVWYGSYKDWDDGVPLQKACSMPCAKALWPDFSELDVEREAEEERPARPRKPKAIVAPPTKLERENQLLAEADAIRARRMGKGAA